MTSEDISAFQAKVIRLAAAGKIPNEALDGITQLIAKVNELQTEVNRLRTHRSK